MKLSEKIRQDNPFNIFLSIHEGHRPLWLQGEAGFSERKLSVLRDRLQQDMGIYVADSPDAVRVVMGIRSLGDMRLPYAQSHTRTVYFHGEDDLDSMLWITAALYAPNANPWVEKCNHRLVRVSTYSARQQYCAVAAQKAVEDQLQGISTQQHREQIRQALDFGRKRMASMLPAVGNAVVTQKGYEAWIQKGAPLFGMFARPQDVELSALAKDLFDEELSLDALERWLSYVQGTAQYKQAAQEVSMHVQRVLYACPFSALLNTLDFALKEYLQENSDAQAAIHIASAQEFLREKARFKTLDAAAMQKLFADVQHEYRNAAQCLLCRSLARDSVESVRAEMQRAQIQVREQLVTMYRDLRFFCQLSPTLEVNATVELGWHDLEDVTVQSNETIWTAESLNDLICSAHKDGEVAAWLVSDLLRSREDIRALAYIDQVYGVASSDQGFAAAVFTKPLPKEDI